MRCCDSCGTLSNFPRANPTYLYTDFAPDAAWRGTLIDHDAYLETTNAATRSPRMQVAGRRTRSFATLEPQVSDSGPVLL
eukprot:10246797-Alexandrium_andersonii.AAC.1